MTKRKLFLRGVTKCGIPWHSSFLLFCSNTYHRQRLLGCFSYPEQYKRGSSFEPKCVCQKVSNKLHKREPFPLKVPFPFQKPFSFEKPCSSIPFLSYSFPLMGENVWSESKTIFLFNVFCSVFPGSMMAVHISFQNIHHHITALLNRFIFVLF